MALPTTYKGVGAFGEVAAWMNRINNMLNNFRVIGPGRVVVTERDINLRIDHLLGHPWGDAWPFGVDVVNKNRIKVYNIACQIGDATPVTLADTTITIANSGEYVYFTAPWNGDPITIGVTQTPADFQVTEAHYADFIMQCDLSAPTTLNPDGHASLRKPWGCAGTRQKHPGNFGQF